MISPLTACLLCLCCGGELTPYERLAPQTSVWSQSIDARRIDTTRLAECRENLGVFPVGNGRCFTYLGIGVPQNTLFMMTGPRYQTNGNHNPLGGFGELSMTLREAGATVDLPLQSIVTREIRLQGSCAIAGECPAVLKMIEAGSVRVEPLISAVAPMEEGPGWFERLYKKEPGLFKVLLVP